MIILVVKFVVLILRFTPRRLAFGFGNVLGWIYGNVIRYRRDDALDAIQQSFPAKTPAECRRIRASMYRHLGRTLIDSLRMASMSAETFKKEIFFIDEHHLKSAFEQDKGVVVITAHMGGWETIATIGPLLGYPEAVVVKDVRPASLNTYLVSIRERFGTTVFPRRGAYRGCLRALKQEHKLLGFIIDQNTVRDNGIFVDFFGRPACTTTGGSFLAEQAGCPIVPVVSIRQPDGRQAVHCLPAIDPPKDRSDEEILRVTQASSSAIESMIRQYPEQWIWIHRRWRTQPEPASA